MLSASGASRNVSRLLLSRELELAPIEEEHGCENHDCYNIQRTSSLHHAVSAISMSILPQQFTLYVVARFPTVLP